MALYLYCDRNSALVVHEIHFLNSYLRHESLNEPCPLPLQSQLIMFWIIFLLTIEVGLTLDNGVAITPPMGWMWDAFSCKKQCEGK